MQIATDDNKTNLSFIIYGIFRNIYDHLKN